MFGSWPLVVLFQESGAWTHRRGCYSFTKLTPRPTGSCGSTLIAKLQLLPQLNPHRPVGGQSGPRTAHSHLVVCVCVCTALSWKHTCPHTSAHCGAMRAYGGVVKVEVDCYRLSSELLFLWNKAWPCTVARRGAVPARRSVRRVDNGFYQLDICTAIVTEPGSTLYSCTLWSHTCTLISSEGGWHRSPPLGICTAVVLEPGSTLYSCTSWSHTCMWLGDKGWRWSPPTWYLHSRCHGTGLVPEQLQVARRGAIPTRGLVITVRVDLYHLISALLLSWKCACHVKLHATYGGPGRCWYLASVICVLPLSWSQAYVKLHVTYGGPGRCWCLASVICVLPLSWSQACHVGCMRHTVVLVDVDVWHQSSACCLCHGTRLVMSVACDIWWSWLMLVAGTGLFLHCRCPGTMLSCSGLLYDVVQLLRIAALVFMLIATSTWLWRFELHAVAVGPQLPGQMDAVTRSDAHGRSWLWTINNFCMAAGNWQEKLAADGTAMQMTEFSWRRWLNCNEVDGGIVVR